MLVATWIGRVRISKPGQKQRMKWTRSLLGRRYVMYIFESLVLSTFAGVNNEISTTTPT